MAVSKGQALVSGLPPYISVMVDLLPEPTGNGILKVISPFRRMDGYPFSIFMVKPKKSQKYVLSDGNSILLETQGTNISLHPGMLRQLVNSYGLKLSETLMVFEDSDDPLDARVLRFIQAAIAIEGILRMWGLNSRVRVDAPREGEEPNADTKLSSGRSKSQSNGQSVRRSSPRKSSGKSKATKPARKAAGVRSPKR